MKLGFIGLGKMGSRMVQKLVGEHKVVVWNRSSEPIEELKVKIQNAKGKIESKNLKVAKTVRDLIQQLESPRVVWLMLPAGEVTENMLNELLGLVQKEDIVIDGANSNYKDTERRYRGFTQKEVRFLGIGVSGGIVAFQNGYPLMVGGDKSAYEYIVPVLDSLSKPHGGHQYFGKGGAGHFVKMVHNGIEYGIMQAFGEGFDVLKNSKYNFDLLDVAQLWQRGTIVSSFLLDRAKDALLKESDLSSSKGPIAESGEARWTVEAAAEEGVPVQIIEESLEYRRKSQTDEKIQKSFTSRVVNALRREFGGHEIKR